MADPHASAADRAQTLAQSGDHAHWPSIAKQLAREQYSATAIARIGKNQTLQRTLAAMMLGAIKEREDAAKTARVAKRASPSIKLASVLGRRR